VDLDNDGDKDIHISNGYPKAVIDYDYQTRMFGLRGAETRQRRAVLEALPAYDASDYVFRQRGDLTFSNQTRAWGWSGRASPTGGLRRPGQRRPADMVVNNIDAPAFVYTMSDPAATRRTISQVRLDGEPPNSRGLATLTVSTGGRHQHLYHSPYRGYQSSVDDRPFRAG
jgi:hypothetical protein